MSDGRDGGGPAMRPPCDYGGLLIDFGGVLTTSVWRSFAAFCDEAGIPEDSLRSLFREEPEALAELRMLERGELPDEEFERRLATRLGVGPERLIERLFAGLDTEHAVVAAVSAARAAGVRTGLVSNSWGKGIYQRAPTHLFDALVISGDVGLHKPEPEIYLLAAERIGVEPGRCVFVDDLRENVGGAESVGMTAILHRAPEATVARLEELLGVDLATGAVDLDRRGPSANGESA